MFFEEGIKCCCNDFSSTAFAFHEMIELLIIYFFYFCCLTHYFVAGSQQCGCNKGNHQEELGKISKSSWKRNQDFEGNAKNKLPSMKF